MKILIIAPRVGVKRDAFPFGLAYISAVLKKAGHAVHCLNLNLFHEDIENSIKKSLNVQAFDFVCVGGLSIYYNQIKDIISAVRRIDSKVRIILGGAMASSEPELMFNALSPDYVVIGEGEATIVELLDSIYNKTDINKVCGIAFRDKSGAIILTNPRERIINLDSLPWPDFDGFGFSEHLDNIHPSDFPFLDIFDHPRVYDILGSRACPFHCTFCYHVSGEKYVERSIDSIMKELETAVTRYHINIIAFYDEVFAIHSRRLYELCSRMKTFIGSLSWECKWIMGGLRVDVASEELLRAMKESGCFMVAWGFESYSPAVLKSMRKDITQQQIDKAINLSIRNKITVWGNFIFFDPAETKETAAETINYWKENKYSEIIMQHISLYPGSEVYKLGVANGAIKNKLDFIANHIEDPINITKNMTDREFREVKYDIYEALLLHRIYSVVNWVKKENNGKFTFSVICPHCKKSGEYRNFSDISPGMKIFCRSCRRGFYMFTNKLGITKVILLKAVFRLIPDKLKTVKYFILRYFSMKDRDTLKLGG